MATGYLTCICCCVLIFSKAKAENYTGCGGYFNGRETSTWNQELSGNITSPGYPSNYASRSHCVWMWEAERDYHVNLTIHTISMATVGDTGGTCNDYVEVRNGSSTSTLLYHSCNNQNSSEYLISSNDKYLWMKFYSSSASPGGAGFRASWEMYPRTTLSILLLPRPYKDCPSFRWGCANKECVPVSYICDGYNDCGCGQSHCDEVDCNIPFPLTTGAGFGIGIGSGAFIFLVIFIAASLWEYRVCCPKKEVVIVEKPKVGFMDMFPMGVGAGGGTGNFLEKIRAQVALEEAQEEAEAEEAAGNAKPALEALGKAGITIISEPTEDSLLSEKNSVRKDSKDLTKSDKNTDSKNTNNKEDSQKNLDPKSETNDSSKPDTLHKSPSKLKLVENKVEPIQGDSKKKTKDTPLDKNKTKGNTDKNAKGSTGNTDSKADAARQQTSKVLLTPINNAPAVIETSDCDTEEFELPKEKETPVQAKSKSIKPEKDLKVAPEKDSELNRNGSFSSMGSDKNKSRSPSPPKAVWSTQEKNRPGHLPSRNSAKSLVDTAAVSEESPEQTPPSNSTLAPSPKVTTNTGHK
ncbi:unnamed protein product [Owenia fusiformis]|uniref:Uncharacterized protein n=1 Tax=Owenia fusiformis TaxID=6347 RepID=A0A8J1XGP2_OWEFU|nr:unnamed protein product [Owenia fusiformis]